MYSHPQSRHFCSNTSSNCIANTVPLHADESAISAINDLSDCHFCQSIHGAVAAAHLDDAEDLVRQVKADFQYAHISAKLKALLVIASKVQRGGKHVTNHDVADARMHGATDIEIHDTALTAAAFRRYNRYVNGLHTCQPREADMHAQMGPHLAEHGYLR